MAALSAGDISPRGASLIGWSTAVLFLAVLAVALRFWSRRLSSKLGADDWTILLGLFLATCLYSTGVTICTVGLAGFQQTELTAPQLETFLLIVYIDNIFYTLTLPTIKISILLLYRRIFSVATFHHVSLGVGALVIGWMISTLFAQIFSCTPVKAAWKPLLADHCINQRSFYFGNAISNLLLDVIILCLPIPMVWNLHLSSQRKASLCGIFLLGGFVCICSILRIVFLGKIDLQDVTYTDALVGIWTNVEPCIGIVCACLPTLPNLLRLWYRKAKTLTSSQKLAVTGRGDKQISKLGGAVKSDLDNGYEELDDIGLSKTGSKPDHWEGRNSREDEIGMQPMKIRQDI